MELSQKWSSYLFFIDWLIDWSIDLFIDLSIYLFYSFIYLFIILADFLFVFICYFKLFIHFWVVNFCTRLYFVLKSPHTMLARQKYFFLV